MKSKNVCFIIPTVSAGGIETYLLRFLDYLGYNHNITVVIRGSKDGELKQEYLNREVRLLFMPLGYLNPGRAFRYYRFFYKEQFDVVCDFNANFAGMAMLMARLAGVQRRVAFYRQGRDHFKPSLMRNVVNKFLNHLVYRNATSILFNSRAALNVFFSYRTNEDDRFEVVYNGIDANSVKYDGSQREARRTLGLPEDKFIIGHVGRNDPAKNHETILKTASYLIRKRDNIHFILCGSGTETLEEEKSRYGLNERMTILGYRDDVPLVLKSLDLFYFPSKTEGQPNALIEAMLAGIPIMASDIEPIRECLPDGYHKYLTDPENWKKFSELGVLFSEKSVYKDLVPWAEKKFESNKNFKKFKYQLIDG